ncbi:hypothetical protein [Nocardioides dongxiaopingii]|uniref:hypothetical protein n=1 Tax=Nocardioides dongxiaopingii TaxID=2576036 RepID=UPI0010C769C6|nr:hypothetical protein [Nocardioides dongxiaopingii]
MTTSTTQPRRRRLTAGGIGLVCGVAALSVSLGVPSEAAKLITGKDVKNSSLTGKDVKKDSLTGSDVKEKTLQGVLKSGQVAAFGDAESVSIDNFVTAAFTPVVSTAVTAPTSGVLYITGTLSSEDDITIPGSGRLQYGLSLDGSQLSDGVHALDYDNETVGNDDSGAATAVVPVSAGSHTVALTARNLGGGSFILAREVSVMFVPSGSGFTPPAKPSAPKTQ